MLRFFFQTRSTAINKPSVPWVKISMQIMLQESLLSILLLTVEPTQKINLSNQTLIAQRTYPVSRFMNNLKNIGIQEDWVKQGEDFLCDSHFPLWHQECISKCSKWQFSKRYLRALRQQRALMSGNVPSTPENHMRAMSHNSVDCWFVLS